MADDNIIYPEPWTVEHQGREFTFKHVQIGDETTVEVTTGNLWFRMRIEHEGCTFEIEHPNTVPVEIEHLETWLSGQILSHDE